MISLGNAMIRPNRRGGLERAAVAVEPSHKWVSVGHMGSEQNEFMCIHCRAQALIPFGSDDLEDGMPLAEVGGACHA